uniref:Uncharacterized protein n=1 Tax=Zea mays TaxID=4577 RepID=C0HIU2_MAIZE|nr:unknown [Zea mays]
MSIYSTHINAMQCKCTARTSHPQQTRFHPGAVPSSRQKTAPPPLRSLHVRLRRVAERRRAGPVREAPHGRRLPMPPKRALRLEAAVHAAPPVHAARVRHPLGLHRLEEVGGARHVLEVLQRLQDLHHLAHQGPRLGVPAQAHAR